MDYVLQLFPFFCRANLRVLCNPYFQLLLIFICINSRMLCMGKIFSSGFKTQEEIRQAEFAAKTQEFKALYPKLKLWDQITPQVCIFGFGFGFGNTNRT